MYRGVGIVTHASHNKLLKYANFLARILPFSATIVAKLGKRSVWTLNLFELAL